MKKFAEHFTIFTEAKFRKIPETLVNKATKIANKYIKEVKKVTPDVLTKLKKIGLTKKWQKYFEEDEGEVWFVVSLTTTKIKDLKTKKTSNYDIYVAFGEDNENYAMCDTENELIIIFDDNARFLEKNKLVSVLVHEIVHGIQQHKRYSKKYEKIKADKTKSSQKTEMYYKEPIEFDAFTTELAHTIKTQYKQINQDIENALLPETKKIMKRRLERFLLELKTFINSPFETYFLYKELSLPTSFRTFEEMLTYINKSPKLWKTFKTKLVNLYNSFKQNDEHTN